MVHVKYLIVCSVGLLLLWANLWCEGCEGMWGSCANFSVLELCGGQNALFASMVCVIGVISTGHLIPSKISAQCGSARV